MACNNNSIETSGLIAYIDISDNDSWNVTTGFSATSLTKWNGATATNLNLLDFGLTGYENGRVDQMYDSIQLTEIDDRLTLYRIGYNTNTGGTFYDLYPLSGITVSGTSIPSGVTTIVTGSTVGNYFQLDGGYLQGFFKLQDYNYEVLPFRYAEGFTFETLININEPITDSILLYMGHRAEDKYNPFFSGESQTVITEVSATTRPFSTSQTITTVSRVTAFTGVETSGGDILNAFIFEDQLKPAFRDFADNTNSVPVAVTANTNYYDSIITFGFNDDAKFVINRVNENGFLESFESENVVTNTGWTIIGITFRPYDIIEDEDLLDCLPNRLGNMVVSINGRPFYTIENFEEIWFKDVTNHKEKVQGVPYNLSWGGGSFGLKHSFHYDFQTRFQYNDQDQTYIDDNFEVLNYPLNTDECAVITGSVAQNEHNLSFVFDNSTFTQIDPCDSNIVTTATTIQISHTGATITTGFTGTSGTTNRHYIEFTEDVEILGNRTYTASTRLVDTGIFNLTGTSRNTIRVIVYNTGDTVTIEEYNDYIPTVSKQNTFQTVSTEFRIPNTLSNTVRIGLLIESNIPLNSGFTFYIDDLKVYGADLLVEDSNKDNLFIERNFDKSFKGGIQKLRIYNTPLSNQTLLNNAIAEFSNPSYGRTITRGGRLIRIA